ncbi:hypothetical protein ADL35_21235 [Streptomyces sp. NRRL WC-3753]|nr:hypothetical protein ADL35_21235 [Streptomyces sp. NRRL WC-3753]
MMAHCGGSVLQRDGLDPAGVPYRHTTAPAAAACATDRSTDPHSRHAHHLHIPHRNRDRDLRQMLLLVQKRLPACALVGHDVQAQPAEEIPPPAARPPQTPA